MLPVGSDETTTTGRPRRVETVSLRTSVSSRRAISLRSVNTS